MLADLENDLIRLVKTSPVGTKVRAIGSLPKLDGKALVARFQTDAPAVYVAPGAFQVTGDGLLLPRFGIAVVIKNAAGQVAARQGDGKAIGLYDLVDALLALFWQCSGAYCAWRVQGFADVDDDLLFNNGVWATVLQIHGTAVEPPLPIDPVTLADFLTFHADYDIAPEQTPAVQAAWSQADYTAGQPDAQDQITLP